VNEGLNGERRQKMKSTMHWGKNLSQINRGKQAKNYEGKKGSTRVGGVRAPAEQRKQKK